MFKLSHFRRQRRAVEWTDARAVTFIVTLAAHRNVTLAAARAGMSRKSAYALQRRDPAFAAAWDAAWAAGALPLRKGPANPTQGDKGDELHNPPVGGALGNTRADVDTDDMSFEDMLQLLRDSGPQRLARVAPHP